MGSTGMQDPTREQAGTAVRFRPSPLGRSEDGEPVHGNRFNCRAATLPAPIAQWTNAPGYEPGEWEFESLWVRVNDKTGR